MNGVLLRPLASQSRSPGGATGSAASEEGIRELAGSKLAKIPQDLVMRSDTNQGEEIVLDGEDKTQAEADTSFPDSASMELSNPEAGV
jgi:hypothetical protein